MADKLILDRNAMKDRSTSHLRIYVGGLTDKAAIEDLYEHFIPYGQINGIVINRNFGFVQFETEASAQQAIAKANGSTFQGKCINVRTAQTNADKQKRETEVVIVDPEIPPAVALTDNIPVANDEETEDMYDSYGNYIGDQQNFREEEYEDRFSQRSEGQDPRGGPRGRGRGGGVRGRGGLPRGGFSDHPSVPENFREEEYEDRFSQRSEGQDTRGGPRGRGRGGGVRGRGGLPRGGFSDRPSVPGPGDWSERGNYDRYSKPMSDYSRPIPVTERNDCEIIVVSKGLTEYAEYIEGRLKRLGIVVDLLFPMEDVPIGKVLGNIASRGCLYAILVMPQNQEHRSLTLTILHGLPQEHRNMPLEDALQLMSRNFQEVQRGGTSGREAVYALLGQLADGRALTVLQYDKVIEYLQERKEQQVKIELGEPLVPSAPTNKTQVELQQRILSILNDKKVAPTNTPPAPVPPPAQTPEKSKLFNDPSVKKALDSILMKFA